MALKEMAKFPREELMLLLEDVGEVVVWVDMERVFAEVNREGGQRGTAGSLAAPLRGNNEPVAHGETGVRVATGNQTRLHAGSTAPVAGVKRKIAGANVEGVEFIDLTDDE